MESRLCIFCDRKADSKEHLWSARLGPEINIRIRAAGSNMRSYKAAELSTSLTGATNRVSRYGMPMTSTTVQCVCHPCNNEWMNNLDQLVYTKLIRLIRGQPASYSSQDTRYLASWIAMKMLVREQWKGSRPVVTRDQCINFRLTGLPPANMRIDLARCDNPLWAAAFHRQMMRTAEVDGIARRAISTMGLGRTIALAEYSDITSPIALLPLTTVQNIWPDGEAFEWPSKPLLPAEVISSYATRYMPNYSSAAESEHTFSDGRPNASTPNRKQRRSQK